MFQKNEIHKNNNDEIKIIEISNETIKKFFFCSNVIFFFISEYGWFLIILLIIFFGFKFQYYHPPQTFYSKTSKEWNSEYIPKIFMHMSDIHISFYLGYRTNGSTNYFSEFLDYNPDFIINSGDVVDSYEESYWPKVGSQWPGDWGIYNDTIKKNISKFKIIDVAGNHDLFAVDSLFSKNNNFLDHSFIFNRTNVKTYDDFIIKKVNISNETFILYNEYVFPTTHPPYGVAPHPTKHILDLLENAVDSCNDCFILTHYQVDRNWFITSSKGNTYKEIISKKNIKAIFTGHDHPSKIMIIHHGQGAVEFCSPTPFKGKAQGLITIDNEQMIYNSVLIKKKGEKPLFFMSYPIPNEQISSHHTFNYNHSEIRIISYARKDVHLKISGDITGEMKFKKKLPNGADLYIFPINLPYGNYIINVYGDGCNITRKFVIGNKFKGNKELSICYLRSLLILRFCSIPLFIGIIIIIFPWGRNIKIAKNLEYIIEGKNYFSIKNYNCVQLLFFLIKLILLGPFIIRERYKLINFSSKLIIFLFALYPLIFPNNIFKPIYGVYGYSFLCFIFIGRRIQYDEWALQITFGYYLSIIFINAIYLGGLKYYNIYINGRLIYIINLILTYLFYFGAIYLNIRFVGESIWWPYLFLTPIYVIIPLILKYIIHFKTFIIQDSKYFEFQQLVSEKPNNPKIIKENK